MFRSLALRAALLAGVLMWTTACQDSSGPRQTPVDSLPNIAGLTVSAPAPAPASSVGGASVNGSVVYVSLAPGSVPTGTQATVRNQTSGRSVTTAVVNGGFDPVAIAASVGDTLIVEVRGPSPDVIRAVQVVAVPRPPIVVRTDPPPRKTDVPLNAIMVIVFSAPIDSTTLTTETVQLWRGSTPVPGTVRFADVAHLRAEFHPDSLLAPQTDYQLFVTQGIRDLNGGALEAAVTIPFTTGTAADLTLPGLIVSSPVAGSSRLAYVSLVPGSVPTGLAARIKHRATRVSVPTAIVNGGFDPVAINASVGDTLAIEITRSHGEPLRVVEVVRAPRPPVVVRTDPPKNRVNVPRNALMVIVFSTPIDSTTLTTESVQLWRGTTRVPGTVRFADVEHLRVEFHPDNLLAGQTDNELVVGEGIKDLSGEALGATVRIPFTTGASQLAFVRDGQIFVMDPVGGAVRQLTAGGRDAWPTWSPDGRRIAFVRFPGPNSVGEIYLMDADGSSTTALFAPIPYGGWGMEFRFAAWSPDGRLLAVHHSNIYYGDIYLLGVDNVDNPMVPVHVASMAAWPAWSPDGKKLAFVRLSGDDGYHDLYSMSMDGSDVSLLASGDGGSIWGPTWSPDGQRIAFSMCRPYDGCDIFTVSANATAATAEDRLTTVGGALFPAWSPDGRWIAFTWWRDGGGTSVGGETSVALVEANGGGQPVQLVSGSSPAWQP